MYGSLGILIERDVVSILSLNQPKEVLQPVLFTPIRN